MVDFPLPRLMTGGYSHQTIRRTLERGIEFPQRCSYLLQWECREGYDGWTIMGI